MSAVAESLHLLVECGTGTVSLCGPQGCGKTTAVQQCLAVRELMCGAGSTTVQCRGLPSKDTVIALLRRIAEDAMQVGCLGGLHTSLGSASEQVLLGIANNALTAVGEFHIVLEDCHALKRGMLAEVCAWVSSLKGPDRLILWVISVPPMEVPGCWRYKFMTKPDASAVHQWVTSCDPQTSLSTSKEITAAANAAKMFLSREPMMSSVLTKDVRVLIKCVFVLRDALITRMDGREPNLLQFSAAWASLEEVVHQPSNGLRGAICLPHASGGGGEAVDMGSPLHTIQSLGISAQLLTLSAFFCGVVNPSFDKEVFSKEAHAGEGGSRKRYASLKDTVISSSNFSFAAHRLYGIYASIITTVPDDNVRVLCLDPTLAMHFQGILLQLGVITPHAGTLLKCHLPPQDAIALGRASSIDIMSLIPMKQ